ncbi:MAG: hypothetical protein R3Y59_08420 [bacterium]
MENITLIKPKFDTCFFERYAQISLETLLGNRYAGLENHDRPDLQDNTIGLGIEVTRAIRESRVEAIKLINEMAADEIVDVPDYSHKELTNFGYVYGLVDKNLVGNTEYLYWLNAAPLRDIIANKVRKVANDFYGNFNEFGLYVFFKDDIKPADIYSVMEYTINLQQDAASKFSTLFISAIDNLYVCYLEDFEFKQYHISDELCRKFFMEALSTNSGGE